MILKSVRRYVLGYLFSPPGFVSVAYLLKKWGIREELSFQIVLVPFLLYGGWLFTKQKERAYKWFGWGIIIVITLAALFEWGFR